MEHHSYRDTVRRLSHRDYGRDYETSEAADKGLLADPTKLAAFSLIELLKRLDDAAQAISPRKADTRRKLTSELGDGKPYPDKEVGDRVFACEDLEFGVSEYVIIAKNEDAVCLMVELDRFNLEWLPLVQIARNWTFATIEEAIVQAVAKDAEYHNPRMKYSQEALQAVEQGENLDRFREQVVFDSASTSEESDDQQNHS